MADSAPTQRLDNDAMRQLERYSTEQMLFHMAEWINALGKGGAVYPQVILPPDEALRKRQMMQGGA